MNYQSEIKTLDKSISRAHKTPAGFIIEVNAVDKTQADLDNLFNKIADHVNREHREIIYSFYTYKSDADRFVVDATLRETRTIKQFNMSTSTLGANDIFCKSTRFDFDLLTLANREEDTTILFIIDESSFCKKPLIKYNELDIEGHQFYISAKAAQVNGHFEICVHFNGEID